MIKSQTVKQVYQFLKNLKSELYKLTFSTSQPVVYNEE